VHEKQIEWATSALPSQAIGYTFGANLQGTAEACLNAGNSWTKEKKQFRCSGLPLEVGLPGQSTAAFCAGQLCVVTAYLMLNQSDHAEHTLKIIANDLVKKYGAPTQQRRIKEPTCDDSFVACIQSAEASWEALWKWKTGEILRATTLVKNKEAFLAIRYQLGEPDSTETVNSNGDTPIDTSAF